MSVHNSPRFATVNIASSNNTSPRDTTKQLHKNSSTTNSNHDLHITIDGLKNISIDPSTNADLIYNRKSYTKSLLDIGVDNFINPSDLTSPLSDSALSSLSRASTIGSRNSKSGSHNSANSYSHSGSANFTGNPIKMCKVSGCNEPRDKLKGERKYCTAHANTGKSSVSNTIMSNPNQRRAVMKQKQ
jgi:hypothetical protein